MRVMDINRRIPTEDSSLRRLVDRSYAQTISQTRNYGEEWCIMISYEDLLSTVEKGKLKWHGHTTNSNGFSKTRYCAWEKEERTAERNILS